MIESTDIVVLQCPHCSSPMGQSDAKIHCKSCGSSYPIVENVPILLDPYNPLFSQEDVAVIERSGFRTGWLHHISRWIPSSGLDKWARKAESRLPTYVAGRNHRCLVVGSGENLQQNAMLYQLFKEVIVTDVSLAPGVTYVCDGHSLPFASDQFDCVVLNAVLEHVLDPEKVVEEVSRVLLLGGIVVASTPFMQPVHMGAYDFRRFTDMGHRWLFRGFDEIERGPVGGAGSALVWSLNYFLSSFCSSHNCALVTKAFGRIFFFWLKYFDYLQSRGIHDAAVGFYFIGRNIKPEQLTESELLKLYRGIDK